ncbi:putative AMP dependent CoA ligase [Cladophialophora carrionii]|uniref:Putative AMP dependent CoA ligase n=1 Tax=Cladophialophora carrionii TaxID=86049 RepID=A0A1C1CNE4_9EURO|nr:putative AMP dependent CoA ligase [Cladophialophora carrionii]
MAKEPSSPTQFMLILFFLLRRFTALLRQILFPVKAVHASNERKAQHSLAEINGGYLPRMNSVFRHLEQGLSRNPDGLAVICLHQKAHHLFDILEPPKCKKCLTSGNLEDTSVSGPKGCLAITYEQLDRTAQKLAAGLVSAHARPGASTLLMLIPNGVEYALLTWCCVLLRITYVCVDPDIASVSGYRGLKDIMRSVRPSIVVTAGVTQAAALDIAIEDLNLPPPIRVSLDDDPSKGWRSLRGLSIRGSSPGAAIDASKLREAAAHDDPNRINSIIFTSGTSGTPKGCPLRVASMCQILQSQSWLFNESNSARALQAAHNSRGIAAFQTLQTWKAGGAVVMISKSCDIQEMTQALRHHAPTFIAVSPSMAVAIREEMTKDPFIADSVKTVQVGGEAVTIGAMEDCSALFPCAKVCVNHGMTEGGGSFYWPFFDTPLDQIPRFGELCPIGAVAPGSAVRIWSTSTQRVVQRCEVGELHIRGGSLLRQYMGGKSPGSFHDDDCGHWLVTGDTAMIDQDGLVTILGRSKDMIVSSAGIIVPVAIETVIQKYLGGSQVQTRPFCHQY